MPPCDKGTIRQRIFAHFCNASSVWPQAPTGIHKLAQLTPQTYVLQQSKTAYLTRTQRAW